jgi:glutathione S-transferase
MALKIYGVARSRAFRTLWMAEELGLAYEHAKVDFATGETHMLKSQRAHPGHRGSRVRPLGINGDLPLSREVTLPENRRVAQNCAERPAERAARKLQREQRGYAAIFGRSIKKDAFSRPAAQARAKTII